MKGGVYRMLTDENKKLNILKDRKLDRQEKNKSEGLKKGKGATLCSNLC